MWIKINNTPIETNNIIDVSDVCKVTSNDINSWNLDWRINRRNYHYYSGNDMHQYVLNYAEKNNKCKGKLNNYVKKVNDISSTEHILKSTFCLDCDMFLFSVNYEHVVVNTDNMCVKKPVQLFSKVYESYEDAIIAHSNLKSKLEELEKSIININI